MTIDTTVVGEKKAFDGHAQTTLSPINRAAGPCKQRASFTCEAPTRDELRLTGRNSKLQQVPRSLERTRVSAKCVIGQVPK